MKNPLVCQKSSYGNYAVAVSILCLAASIVYFAKQLSSLEKVADTLAVYRDVAPELIAEVANISDQIPLIVNEMESVRVQIPAILAEVSALRKDTIPAILVESQALREDTIPLVMAESVALREQTIPAVLLESKTLREQALPAILLEVKKTREELPMLLTQATTVAKTAGKNASEGVVSGFFSGIIKAPINLMSGAGGAFSKSENLTVTDKKLINEASMLTLQKNYLGATQTWSNSNNDHRGDITLTAMVVNGDERCRELTYSGFKRREKLGKSLMVLCHDEKGKWSSKE
jgi:surface antigen